MRYSPISTRVFALALALAFSLTPLPSSSQEERPGQSIQQPNDKKGGLAKPMPPRKALIPRSQRQVLIQPGKIMPRPTISSERSELGVSFLGGPIKIMRDNGYGRCRGLHSGRHWAPSIGWHNATHRGWFRCRW